MALTDKIIEFGLIRDWLAGRDSTGSRIVLTNGCFDILHAGHVSFLEEAAGLGTHLVVGLNSDRSTRRLKGADRPINKERDRAIVLAGLSSVAAVTIFDQDNACELISAVRPNIYVKGGDYSIESINQDERRLVEVNGGEVRILRHVPGVSTTRTAEAVLQKQSPGS